jgi:anaerobic ribonucleoside-triphosphate reductase
MKTAGKGVGFHRIRRVTGYLTGDVKFMNNAKQAEVRERVKHVTPVNNKPQAKVV